MSTRSLLYYIFFYENVTELWDMLFDFIFNDDVVEAEDNPNQHILDELEF